MSISPTSKRIMTRAQFAGVVVLANAALSAGIIFSTRGGDAAAAAAPPAPQAVTASVAAVILAPVSPWDSFSGRLEAVDRVEVRSRVSGAVQHVHFREGGLVKAGDLLVSIDPAPYAADVERAQAQVAAAEARRQHEYSEQQRAQRLWEERAIAQRELDEHIYGLRDAEANLSALRASLTSARLNLGYTQVRAPISGRVGRIDVTVGNLVAAGPASPVLTTLVSVNPIYASFDADEQLVLRALKDVPGGDGDRRHIDRIPVRMGTSANDGTPYVGTLRLIDNQVDMRSGTIRVRARFDNVDGALIPGQFAKIRIGRAQDRQELLIAERAVGTDQKKNFVLVVGNDNKAVYREIVLGAGVDGLRIVTAGLKPGERIVVDGGQRVRPGALVVPKVVPMATPHEASAT